MAASYSRSPSSQSSGQTSDQKPEIKLWTIFDVILRNYKGRARLQQVRRLFPAEWTESVIRSKLEQDPGQRFTVIINKAGDISFISVHCRAKLCTYYGQGHCSRQHCNNFHLCRSYLAGHCRNGVLCPQNHSFQQEFNKNLVKRMRLAKYSENELRCIIRRSILQVCFLYNRSDCTYGDSCSNLHVCEASIMKDCGNPDCRLEHSLETEHNMRLLKCFKLDKLFEENPKMLKKCLLTKKDEKLKKQLDDLRRTDPNMEVRHIAQANSDASQGGKQDQSSNVEIAEEASETDKENTGDVWITLKCRYSSDQTEGTRDHKTQEDSGDEAKPSVVQESQKTEGWASSAGKTPGNPESRYAYETRKTTREEINIDRRAAYQHKKHDDDNNDLSSEYPTEREDSHHRRTRRTVTEASGSDEYLLFTPSKNTSGQSNMKRYLSVGQRVKENPVDHRHAGSARRVEHGDFLYDDQLALSMEDRKGDDKAKRSYTFARQRSDDNSSIDMEAARASFHEKENPFPYPTYVNPVKREVSSGVGHSYTNHRTTSASIPTRDLAYDGMDFMPKLTTRHTDRATKPSIAGVPSAGAEPQFICDQYLLRGKCTEQSCKYLHAHRPFAWFANVFGEWHQFDENEEVELEKANTQKQICVVKIKIPGYSVKANVDTRTTTAVALDDQMSRFQVKRISARME